MRRKTRIGRMRSRHLMNASPQQQLFCGLDVHRSGFSYATVVDCLGNKIKERKLSNESIPKFLEAYRNAKIAMEAQMSIIPI